MKILDPATDEYLLINPAGGEVLLQYFHPIRDIVISHDQQWALIKIGTGSYDPEYLYLVKLE